MTPPITWKVTVDGDDLLISGHASWFGGPHDPDDNGETASGVNNTKMGTLGCALPMAVSNGRRVLGCMGSPVPALPWDTKVKLTCGTNTETVGLIDVGPDLVENRPVDLTPQTFVNLGGDLKAGIISVDLRILGGALFLPAPL